MASFYKMTGWALSLWCQQKIWEAFHKPIYFAILTLLSATNQFLMHLFLPWWLTQSEQTYYCFWCYLLVFSLFSLCFWNSVIKCCSGCVCVCVWFFISMFGISIALFHSHFNELCQYKCSPPPALPLSFCHSSLSLSSCLYHPLSLSLSLSLPVFTILSLSLSLCQL